MLARQKMSPATRGYNLTDDVTALAQLYALYSILYTLLEHALSINDSALNPNFTIITG